MAGTVTVTRAPIKFPRGKIIDKVTIDWTADAADGSVPDTPIEGLYGYLLKVLTNPGATAPTDNYDIVLKEPDDTTVDAANSLLLNRDTANSEAAYPYVTNAVTPVLLTGTYTFSLSGNSVNSATGTVILFVSETL